MKNYHTTILTVLIAILCTFSLHKTNASDRPNIVFILADDLGYGDINAFGATSVILIHPILTSSVLRE
jgi:hypothetical protein